jgi:hypothetical protein
LRTGNVKITDFTPEDAIGDRETFVLIWLMFTLLLTAEDVLLHIGHRVNQKVHEN